MHDTAALQSLLEKEVEILTELNSLSLLKKDALLTDDLDSLESIVLKEEALSGNLKTLDNACSPQVQFFLREKKQPTQSSANFPAPLGDLFSTIRLLILQLKTTNDFNQALIKDSLYIIQFTLNSFLSLGNNTSPTVYGASGKQAQTPHLSLLDVKR